MGDEYLEYLREKKDAREKKMKIYNELSEKRVEMDFMEMLVMLDSHNMNHWWLRECIETALGMYKGDESKKGIYLSSENSNFGNPDTILTEECWTEEKDGEMSVSFALTVYDLEGAERYLSEEGIEFLKKVGPSIFSRIVLNKESFKKIKKFYKDIF